MQFFSNKVIDLQAQEFLVGLDHCCKILLRKYPRYVPSPAWVVDRTAPECPDWALSYTEVNLGQIHETLRMNNEKSGTER